VLEAQDITVPSGGWFGHTRSYGNRQAVGAVQGPNGYNWWVQQLPYAGSVSSTILQITISPKKTYWFDKSGTTFAPRYSFLDVRLAQNTSAGTLTFADNSQGKTETIVLSSSTGQFISHTDGRGVQTSITSVSGGLINGLQRSFNDSSGVITTEQLIYNYGSGALTGILQSVTYQIQVGAGTGFVPVKQVAYTYYDASDPNGNPKDLQSAAQQLPNGSGGWNTVGVDYYRYWIASSTYGFVHGLAMHFGPEAYRLIFNLGIDITNNADAPDTLVQPYADHYFQYDSSWRVTEEISAVCPSCPGGGTTSDTYLYTPNTSYPGDGYNTWKMCTTQTLPDGSKIVVYSNYAAQVMLKVRIDSTGTSMWATYYRYQSDGQVMWEAMPSAVEIPVGGLSVMAAFSDLMNASSGTYQFLNSSGGLINVTSYDSMGNLLTQGVQQGSTGTTVAVMSYTYTSNNTSGNIITPVLTESSYNGSSTITMTYGYNWSSGTNVMTLRQTSLPIISTAQNGPGGTTPLTIIEQFDSFGNLIQRTDERGVVNQYSYSLYQSRMTEQVLNYNTSASGLVGYNVTTDYTYDTQGRLTLKLGPSHQVVIGAGGGSSGTPTTVRPVTSVAYNQSNQPALGTNWPVDQTFSGTGYATGSVGSYIYTLVNPFSISQIDKDGRSTDSINAVRTSGGGTSGTGLLSPTDGFAQSSWQSWSSTQYNISHQTMSSCTYFTIPSSGTGTEGTNYGMTRYGYDQLERRNYYNSPGGTITRTIWTATQWVASVWMGTNDAGASDLHPDNGGTPPNNMVMVSQNIYDNGTTTNPAGAGGDGNLVQQILHDSATTSRVTNYTYDFRDRRIGAVDPIGRYTTFLIDNLSRIYETDIYSSNLSGGVPIGKSTVAYDDLSRTFNTSTYAVNISTGAVGSYLFSNTWYDQSGNTIQQIQQGAGQVFTKSAYNGVGWVIGTYRGYNTNGTSYAQASAIVDANDVIVTQSIPTYDLAGNIISQAYFDRLNDATLAGLPLSADGSAPAARVGYTATWFDELDRPFANVNYGVQGSAPIIPGTPPTASQNGSGGSLSWLLTGTVFNASSGWVDQTIDPNNVVMQLYYDAAHRKTQSIEDFNSSSGHINRTTNWTYNVDNLVTQLQAVNANTGSGVQNTNYSYGTTSTSGVFRNDLLASVTYPDTGVVSYTYNRLGQVQTIQDQRGTVRTLSYDLLGRLSNDTVTTPGTGTDNTSTVQIASTYEIRGMLQTVASNNSGGSVLNEVQMTYNDFGQLIAEQQDHTGSVSGSSPLVQYNYSSGASSANQVRPSTLIYPNGRVLTLSYGTSGGMNDLLNRIDTIQDTTLGTTNLASYVYLGSGMVLQVIYSEPGAMLDLWGGTSGVFNGLDLYNRIIDQRWATTS
jgi:YD repeat-containing protein